MKNLLLVVAVLGLTVACGKSPVPCGPGNCTGCCDASGMCQSLASSTACGSNGAACVQCPAGQSCSFGACTGSFGTGGGFSGTGGGPAGGSSGGGSSGGGSTGGGSAGGFAGGGNAGGGGGGGIPTSDGGVADVMLLVDISGSMNTPIPPLGPSCTDAGVTCSGASCPASCPTRISVLRSSVTAFLQSNGTAARYGLSLFPVNDPSFTPNGCAPARAESVPMLSPTAPTTTGALNSQTNAVRNFVSGLGSTTPVTGGTPTAASLRFAGTVPALATSTGRPRGVVLITDGLPNCNTANPISCTLMPPPAMDLCTLGANCTGLYCAAGYLDQVSTVQAVSALRLSGIRTAIIVLSDSPTTQITSVMNAMADEGGATACATTNPGCLQRFFFANSEVSLSQALTAALQRVSVP